MLLSKDMENLTQPQFTTQEFLESVLRLAPRVAAFDCDGTLWSGDAGENFFDWEIRTGVVPADLGQRMRARYSEYKTGKVSEDQMCGEMVTMHAGMTEDQMMKVASKFMRNHFKSTVFAEMKELVLRLQDDGCDVWAVSSSNEWVIRAGMGPFGIADDHILATKAELK